MRTLTEILNAEHAVHERARQYEQTLSRLNSSEKEVATITPRVAHLREQIALLDDVAAKARLIDPTIVARESYAARDILVAHVSAAQENAKAKIDKYEAQLKALTAELPRLRAAVDALKQA